MSITLTVGPTTVEIHPDLYWADEFGWHPVEQTYTRTITGGSVVQVADRLDGRPITLQPIDDASAWMSRETLEQVRNWAAVPDLTLTLTLRGTSYLVRFRHHEGSPVEAEPVVHFNTVDLSDQYRVTIRLMEVAA